LTQSIRISDDRLYVLCEDAEYRGFCRYLGRGEAANATALGGLAGQVSSINIQPDHSATRESKLILMHEPSRAERI
jgi:Beta/Gamma crystallin